jgi:peptide/nickel transport system substrate-binding protein
MSAAYWRHLTNSRLSRRRALATAGGSALGTALIAACGGASNDRPTEDVPGLIAKASDETKAGKRGGIYKSTLPYDIAHFDPHITEVTSRWPTLWGYSRLAVAKPGFLSNPDGEIAGDLAESWEYSPDRLTLTMKLRTDAKFAPLAPVNGRTVDADDVLFSWNRFVQSGTERSKFANSASPSAPILSLSAPDSRTLVFKLKEPTASMLATIANSNCGNLFILPKEAERLDVRRQPVGSGPYYLAEYSPSARIVYKRNPGFYDKQFPFVDTIELPIIPEYASGLAQFIAGAVYSFGVRADDVLATKEQVPDLVMQQGEVNPSLVRTFYGWRAGSDRAPFKDERLRQAYSMAIDRDLFIDVMYGVDRYRAQGINVETRWNTALRANEFEGWWLDPRGKDFGPNAKYYQKDLAEARKLMAASGFAAGFDVDAPVTATYPGAADFPKQVQLIVGMVADAGIRMKTSVIDGTEAGNRYRDTKGNFDGVTYRVAGIGGFVDIGEKLYSEFNTGGGQLFIGFDPDGKGTYAGDPRTQDLTDKMRSEFDQKKRIALVQDLQRYNAAKQYSTLLPGGAAGLNLAWPIVRNRGVYRTSLHWPLNHFEWLDETKAPLKKT